MPILIYGFDEGKNKNEVYSKDDVYNKDEVYSKTEVDPLLSAKQDKHGKAIIKLLAANWVANTQRISVDGVTANNTVLVSANYSDVEEYSACGVVCMGQYAGELAFSCKYTPTNDLWVNIVILEV